MTVIGLVLGFFERLKRPSVLLLEHSPNFPDWLGWVAWGLAAAGTLVLIFA